jgi:hypothetical protein
MIYLHVIYRLDRLEKGESRLNYSGSSVSSAGDVNGDGLDDLIVGAFQADPSGKSHAGKSYVVFASPLTSPALETECPLKSRADSPLITKPPVPAAMADNSMASVLSFLPNTTANQRVIIVAIQSPAQVMSMAMD